jgi:hypothetical protein
MMLQWLALMKPAKLAKKCGHCFNHILKLAALLCKHRWRL